MRYDFRFISDNYTATAALTAAQLREVADAAELEACFTAATVAEVRTRVCLAVWRAVVRALGGQYHPTDIQCSDLQWIPAVLGGAARADGATNLEVGGSPRLGWLTAVRLG